MYNTIIHNTPSASLEQMTAQWVSQLHVRHMYTLQWPAYISLPLELVSHWHSLQGPICSASVLLHTNLMALFEGVSNGSCAVHAEFLQFTDMHSCILMRLNALHWQAMTLRMHVVIQWATGLCWVTCSGLRWVTVGYISLTMLLYTYIVLHLSKYTFCLFYRFIRLGASL